MAENDQPLFNIDALPHNADWLKGGLMEAKRTPEDRARIRAAHVAQEAARLRQIETRHRVDPQRPPIGEGREAMEEWARNLVDEVLDDE